MAKQDKRAVAICSLRADVSRALVCRAAQQMLFCQMQMSNIALLVATFSSAVENILSTLHCQNLNNLITPFQECRKHWIQSNKENNNDVRSMKPEGKKSSLSLELHWEFLLYTAVQDVSQIFAGESFIFGRAFPSLRSSSMSSPAAPLSSHKKHPLPPT